jgi:predicted nuclease of predicted toxin-antitoxin system
VLRIYADECVGARIVEQLRRRGVDVVSAADERLLGDADHVHLARATQLGRVVLSADQDFLALTKELGAHRTSFPGLIFIRPRQTIGDTVRSILLAVEVLDAADMVNHVEWVP